MSITIKDPEGFILIGGASSRMGRDKAQMTLGGQKLFERAAAALSVVCPTRITLVGNRGAHFESDLLVVPDMSLDSTAHLQASIFGLYTAWVAAKTPWIAVLACDLPFVTGDLMIRLAGYCLNEFDAVIPIQSDTKPQPLCGFYRAGRCTHVVEAMIRNGDLKIQKLLSRLNTRFVGFDEIADLDGSANFLFNINSQADYETALKIAAR